MKINVLITGILLIVGACLDDVLTPTYLDKMINLTTNFEQKAVPIAQKVQDPSNPDSDLESGKLIISKVNSFVTLLMKVSEYSAWSTAFVGMGVVAYGILAKTKLRIKQ